MGWSIGYDSFWKRDIGYGVPAMCDREGCTEEIDRGLSCVCGGEPYGGDRGCGLYFCSAHLLVGATERTRLLCSRCYPRVKEPFKPSADVARWIAHKLTDESWEEWRKENPDEVAVLQAATPPESLERVEEKSK